MGNASVSTLIRSANSAATAKAEYEDKIKSMEWENSAQTDADYQEYSKYLSSRIDKLTKVGSLSAASKAATLTSTAQSATRSWVSNSIQRTTQAVIDGSASSTDKLEQIRNLYYMAVDSGDENLAQNLYSQYQSYDMQVQKEAIAAQNAAEALAEKNAKAMKAGYDSAIDLIENNIDDLGRLIKSGEQAVLTKEEKEQSKQIIANLKAAGVDVSGMEGKAMNNGSLVSGALDALYELNKQAAIALNPTNPDQAQTYYDKMEAIYNSRADGGSIKVAGIDMTKEIADQWAAQPLMYHSDMDVNGQVSLVKSVPTGFAYDASGRVIPVFNENNLMTATEEWATDKNASSRKKAQKELEKLGFTIENDNNSSGAFNIKVSDATNPMVKQFIDANGMSKDTEFMVRKMGDNYVLYSGYTTKTGDTPLLYLSRDNKGYYGLNQAKFNSITGQTDYVSLGQSDKRYNRLNNSLVTSVGKYTSYGAIQKAFGNGTNLSIGSENYKITQIANQYYGGDIKKAASDVFAYKQNLQRQAIMPAQTVPKTQTEIVNRITSTQLPNMPKSTVSPYINLSLDPFANRKVATTPAKSTPAKTTTKKTTVPTTSKPINKINLSLDPFANRF